jgi:DNA-binding transcriptional regulator YhcF (GntR family)
VSVNIALVSSYPRNLSYRFGRYEAQGLASRRERPDGGVSEGETAMSEGRLADRAYTGIVEMINSDGLEVGDRLPSEARLAEMFGMSRTVVREALVRLAADSITEARRGAGSFIKNRPSDKLGAYMPLSELPSTMGSYEVRFVLEAEAARLAAVRRSAEEMVSHRGGAVSVAHGPDVQRPGPRRGHGAASPDRAGHRQSSLPGRLRGAGGRC